MLNGYGFKEIYNLSGGITGWQGHKATGPEDLNLDLVRGDETPTEIAALAIGMEVSLVRFYESLLAKTLDSDVEQLFAKMVEVSNLHRQKFEEFYRHIEPGGDLDRLRSSVNTEIMEGGYDMDDFLRKNGPHMQTLMGALDIAIMLETQALDLYGRFAARAGVQAARDFLLQVAQEEKVHLNMLGQLLEDKVRSGAV